MKRGWILASAITGVLSLGVASVHGQTVPDSTAAPTPIPGLGFTESGGVESLGSEFTSQAAGISIRPPAGARTVRRAVGDLVVDFIHEEKKINLRVTRTVLSKPMKLTAPPPDKKQQDDPDFQPERGMLDFSTDSLLMNLPIHKVLRKDVIPLAGHDAGIIIVRASTGVQDSIVQQAVIQSNERLYYTIYMSSPGQPANPPRDPAKPDEEPKVLPPNEVEKEAAQLFRTVLDSVRVLDPEKLRADQEDRLFKTRALFLTWSEAKHRSILIKEQWMRVLKDGKDVGYSYIVEDTEQRGVNPGVKVGIRSRMLSTPVKPTDSTTQLDTETWYHVAFDRRTESWTSQAFFQESKGKELEKFLVSEFGTSTQREKAVRDNAGFGEGIDPRNPGVKVVPTYTINVHRKGKAANPPPIERDLPPYYIPQGTVHLLPRLMPIDRPAKYMFAAWVSNTNEVMHRYVDVVEPKEVTFNGKKLFVVPIVERVGFDGSPTTHYMSRSGTYLGSESVSIDNTGVRTVITVLPTDAATLQGLWKGGANLAPPEEKLPDVPTPSVKK
jgi:hypothetical protein